MRIAIVNLGGNQGKTTLAVNLFAPRMPGAMILAVETHNADGAELGVDVEKMRGEQFGRIYTELAAANDLILDVGASNIAQFLTGLSTFEDGHDEIDIFVIPVTSDKKERHEAMKTALMLADLGVPGEKVHFVFNRVELTQSVEEKFPDVLDFAKKTKHAIANPECYIQESLVFGLMAVQKTNISAVLADQTDYKARVQEALASEEGREGKAWKKASTALQTQKQAKSLDRRMEKVFRLLTGSEA